MKRIFMFAALVCLATVAALAQGLPTSQPDFLQISREEVKVGHSYDHVKVEAGWPAAFARAKSPDYYLALESMTGTNEVWFVAPYGSQAAYGDSMKRDNDNAVLSAELARLSRADAEHISGARTLHAIARKDLSQGPFPATESQRFFQITLFRVRPGHEPEFEAAAKTYGAGLGRVSPTASFRIYQIVAGLPGPSFLIFSSFQSFGEFDKMMAAGQEVMKGLKSEEQSTMRKFASEGLVNSETNRYRLDPEMSYVPQQVRDQDPAFWKPKKPAAKPAPKPAER